jgi:hypothetical protein
MNIIKLSANTNQGKCSTENIKNNKYKFHEKKKEKWRCLQLQLFLTSWRIFPKPLA